MKIFTWIEHLSIWQLDDNHAVHGLESNFKVKLEKVIFGLNSRNVFISLILLTDDRYNYYRLHFMARKKLKNKNVYLPVTNFIYHLRSSSLVLKSFSVTFVDTSLSIRGFSYSALIEQSSPGPLTSSVLHGQTTPGCYGFF